MVPAKNAPRSRMVMSQKKRRKFLELLAQTGRVKESALAVGFTTTSFLNKLRREDEDFADDWDHALIAATNVLEDEAIRRATEGVLDPVYYKGAVVGYKVNYSDTLLMFILRGLNPDKYREKAHGGTNVNLKFGIAVMPMTAPTEAGWETKAIEMHASQQTLTLEDKPTENKLITAKRGD